MRAKILVPLFAAVVLAGAGWGVWRSWPPQPRPLFAEYQLADTKLRVHTDYLRPGEAPAAASAHVDLVARFPDFAPAGAAARDASVLLFLRLQPSDASLDPQDRTAKLYARFLESDPWSHPGGLTMRRFDKASPYEREDLYFAPPEGRLFAARCMRPLQPPDGLPNTCIAELRLRGLDAQMRFAPELLPEWERLMEGARALVETMAR